MTVYFQLSHHRSAQHLLDVQMRFKPENSGLVELVLPCWRPGRYEVGDFASRTRAFRIQDSNGKILRHSKVDSYTWRVMDEVDGEVQVQYEFYAEIVNAGSTYLDADRMYVNPVNALMHPKGHMDAKVEVLFDVPKEFRYAGMLTQRARKMKAKDFDALYDSPFVWSRNLQIHRFKAGSVATEVAIEGDAPFDKKRIEKDFKAFMAKQLKAFGDCPVKRYTYLIMATPHRYYHGVEHELGTTIALGPSRSLMSSDIYQDLLAVSSHEFYHTWNVKYMRPKEMWPYDFTGPNYTRTGYIIEGITTYQGDVKLWQSKVSDDEQFLKELKTHLDRHVQNPGRYNHSVRESSFDTWLDGYGRGIPDRKVSIYTEGALLALLLDLMLLDTSKGKVSLDTVMKELYEHCKQEGRGYEERFYLERMENYLGKKARRFFKQYVDKAESYESAVVKALTKIGVKVKANPIDRMASQFGIRLDASSQPKVIAVHPCSDAYSAGVHRDMELIGINRLYVQGDAEKLLGQGVQTLLFKEGKTLKTYELGPSETLLFRQYSLELKKKGGSKEWKRWRDFSA